MHARERQGVPQMQEPCVVTRNKTIVMRDKTANKSVDVVINEALRGKVSLRGSLQVLAETSWGHLEEDCWVMVSTKCLAVWMKTLWPEAHFPSTRGGRIGVLAATWPDAMAQVSYAECLEAQLPGSDKRKERQKLKGPSKKMAVMMAQVPLPHQGAQGRVWHNTMQVFANS